MRLELCLKAQSVLGAPPGVRKQPCINNRQAPTVYAELKSLECSSINYVPLFHILSGLFSTMTRLQTAAS